MFGCALPEVFQSSFCSGNKLVLFVMGRCKSLRGRTVVNRVLMHLFVLSGYHSFHGTQYGLLQRVLMQCKICPLAFTQTPRLALFRKVLSFPD